jgi:hypothetical protein
LFRSQILTRHVLATTPPGRPRQRRRLAAAVRVVRRRAGTASVDGGGKRATTTATVCARDFFLAPLEAETRRLWFALLHQPVHVPHARCPAAAVAV